jgi:hypothetical protein
LDKFRHFEIQYKKITVFVTGRIGWSQAVSQL